MVSSRTIVKVLLVAAAVVAGLYLLYLIRKVVGAVFIAVFLAVVLAPAVDFFERRKIPRSLAIVLVYLSIFLGMFGVGLLVVPPIVSGVNHFVNKVPSYVDDLRKNKQIREYDDKNHITEKLKKQADKLPSRLGDAVGALRSVTVGIFSAIFQLVTVLVMTFFLLLDGKRITNFLFKQLSPEREKRFRAVATDVYQAVGGYVVGNVAISIVAGLTTYIVLKILGVPFAVPLSVLMAFLDLIPLVGSTIAGVVVGIAAAFADFPTSLIIWLVYLVVYQQFENNVLQPFVYRRTVALHPLLVIIGVLIGASLLGVLGALLAIPIAATIQIIVKDWWSFRQQGQARETPPPAPAAPSPAG